jgi:hypothetical protein
LKHSFSRYLLPVHKLVKSIGESRQRKSPSLAQVQLV